MPLTVKKRGSKYVVTDTSGKEFGSHPTKKAAVNQLAAIESSKRSKSGADLLAEDKIRVEAGELQPAQGAAAPMVIVTDGTPEGTMFMINGQEIQFDSLYVDCYKDGNYPSCSISLTVKEKDESGLEVRRSMTLRKEKELDN